MSGGFFRGTSADQDTRFSNKQAKLLKSQKFPPELDQLVDMTKVKMDVIRPWIANRATEFLGFEDEVLINFIYGLLDGKEVDGKQIQIQLTGFMEKNTGKFMKELWSLLTSAQKNASGIPQQFLDAKAEETRKKKAETDRINYEVQKKKEQEDKEAEQERKNKINADLETAKNAAAAAAVTAKVSLGKASSHSNPDEEKSDGRRLARSGGKNGDTGLSHDGDCSPLSHRSASSFSRSRSHSYSPSKSPSRSPPLLKSHRSENISRSPRHRQRSTSPARRVRSPKQSPPRRKRSPLYTRSPRRRSPSPWRRRPSPSMRRRSPMAPPRRRSPSPPLRRHSPLPPLRRRSASPPLRRRSPSPRRRSPSPPLRRRSPSPPLRRRSPSPPLRRRSPVPRYRRRSPIPSPKKHQVGSQSPRRRKSSRSRSPQYRSYWTMNREHGSRYSDMESRGYRDRPQAKRSPDHEYPVREENEYDRPQHVRSGGRTFIESQNYKRHLPIQQSRSPKRDVKISSGGPSNVPDKSSPYNQSSPSPSHSPEHSTRTYMNDERRRLTPQRSRIEPIREERSHRDNPEIRKTQYNFDIEDVDRRVNKVNLPKRRDVQAPHLPDRKEYGPRRPDRIQDTPNEMPLNLSVENHDRQEISEPRRKEYHARSSDNVDRSIDHSQRRRSIQTYTSEEIEYGPGRLDHGRLSPNDVPANRSGLNRPILDSLSHIEYRRDEEPTRDSYGDVDGTLSKVGAGRKPIQKLESVKQVVGSDSDAEEGEDHRRKHVEKRKARRDEDEDGSMSPRSSEERREAKRRKKEEKRLRKEEKRRRREERHRRKEERRASKAKGKAVVTVTPPEKDYSGADDSDDNSHDRDQTCKGQNEEVENEQQRLEIELRRKALESLRAKKAVSH